MHSSTSNSNRDIPDLAWRPVLAISILIALAATIGWEFYTRSLGYAPTLNDSGYLWADERDKLQDDSFVLIGSSRILFDTDLAILEDGIGRKPLQLAMTGASFYPTLQNLAEEKSFKGSIVIGVVPAMLPVPMGPPIERAAGAIKVWNTRTPSEKFSQRIALHLEERIAFLKDGELNLAALLPKLPIPNRVGARVPPALPPYFATVERNRRYRMTEAAATPGEFQTYIQNLWPPLFSPPPPPSYVPPEAFMKAMMEGGAQQFEAVVALINQLQERGVKIVLVRFPSSGGLRELERNAAPRERLWDPLVQLTGAPAIHFEDHPELASFECPEWSHLSGPDSEEFTRRLIPHLKRALASE